MRFSVSGFSVIVSALALTLYAQVSPGSLSSKAHESLEGSFECRACHTFGAGSFKIRCLQCHGEMGALASTRELPRARREKGRRGMCSVSHGTLRPELQDLQMGDFQRRIRPHPDGLSAGGAKHAGVNCEKCHNAKNIAAADRKLI